MIIKSVQIKNFRSIVDESLHFESLTALVGPNGSGKSSVLRALELFYGQNPNLGADDFYNRDTSREISVSVTFTGLSQEAREKFAPYIENDELTVERIAFWDSGRAASQLHGSRMLDPSFDRVRTASSAADKKTAYGVIRQKAPYDKLPPWKNQQEAMDALKGWESENPATCSRQRDDGQFFGFKEAAQGYLGRYTRPLFIPAVRDASSDAMEGRGSVLTSLLDMVVRSELAKKEEIKRIQQDTLAKYREVLSPEKLVELGTLADRLSGTLRAFAPNASVRLSWQPITEIEIPAPKADARLVEDEFETSVERTGHGLQRSFILTLLQHLALLEAEAVAAETSGEYGGEEGGIDTYPSVLLAIEEPELYQHPNRQRHLARVLLKLAMGGIPGVARQTQVIYTTHSPLLVGLDRFNQVRICRKTRAGPEQPKCTRTVSASLDKVARTVWQADGATGQPYTSATLLPRLRSLMTPMLAEGFFADVVVLAEGEDDRAAIVAVAQALGKDFDSLGISVIQCGGKRSLDRPAAIFRELGIPIYLVWDGDKGVADAQPEDNHRLLRLLGQPVTDWPSGQTSEYTVFPVKLEVTLREELGPAEYDRWTAEVLAEMQMRKEQGLKNPVFYEGVLQRAAAAGRRSQTLEGIVTAVLALKV